jgi:hypothetical protein
MTFAMITTFNTNKQPIDMIGTIDTYTKDKIAPTCNKSKAFQASSILF